MTYFIVEAPYEKCFDLFFKTELGYPNFYRLPELLSNYDQYQHLVLVAPYQTKEPKVIKEIAHKVSTLGMKWVQFGETLDTAFTFDNKGMIEVHPQFKEALHSALNQFAKM